jgi:hypothetical protein
MFREIIAVYVKNHMKRITLFVQKKKIQSY